MEVLELKRTITEMRNSPWEFNNIFELAEERICDLENRSIEIMQSEEQRQK